MKEIVTGYHFETPLNIDSAKNIFVYVKRELDNLKENAIPVYVGEIQNETTKLFLPVNEYSIEIK